MTVYALLLAAGAGRRFGVQPKLLAAFGKQPLLRQPLDRLEALLPGKVIVVLGANAELITPHLQGSAWAHNPHWQQGLSRSLQTGLAALPTDASAVLIALADQPAIGFEQYQQLLVTHQQTGLAVCASIEQRLSVPAVIPQRLFSALNTLSGDKGARELLTQWQAYGELVGLPMNEAALDIDTPEDLYQMNQHMLAES